MLLCFVPEHEFRLGWNDYLIHPVWQPEADVTRFNRT